MVVDVGQCIVNQVQVWYGQQCYCQCDDLDGDDDDQCFVVVQMGLYDVGYVGVQCVQQQCWCEGLQQCVCQWCYFGWSVYQSEQGFGCQQCGYGVVQVQLGIGVDDGVCYGVCLVVLVGFEGLGDGYVDVCVDDVEQYEECGEYLVGNFEGGVVVI